MINVYELWSRYLFNSNQAPIGDALLDNKYIRDADVVGDAVTALLHKGLKGRATLIEPNLSGNLGMRAT